MAHSLSQGVVRSLHAGNTRAYVQPVVQILQIKQLATVAKAGAAPPGADKERFRLVISDGLHYQQAMLATQLNHLVKSNAVTENAIIRIDECIANEVQGKRIVIILRLEVLSHAAATIGTPQNIEGPSAPAAHPPVSAAPPRSAAPGGGYAPPTAYAKSNPPMGRGSGAPPRSAPPFNNNPPPAKSAPPSASSGSYGPSDIGAIYPIKTLTPYTLTRWAIKVRVVNKSPKKSFQSQKGQSGTVASVDLLDAWGSEIRATMFSEAVEKFYDLFELHKVYFISKAQVKPANKKFSNVRNEYELTLGAETIVLPAPDEADIPKMHFSFISIDAINDCQKDDVIDLIAVVYNTGELGSITTKAGKELTKRNVTLVDTSSNTIEMTLWGDRAENVGWSAEDNPIIAVKGVKVSDYNHRTLTSLSSTQIELNPEIQEAFKLSAWWNATRGNLNVFSLTQSSFNRDMGSDGPSTRGPLERKTLSDVKASATLFAANPKGGPTYEAKATVSQIKRDGQPWYDACPKPGCNKKVTPTGAGTYRCDKCDYVYPDFTPRYILSLCCGDSSGSLWMNAFNDAAEAILGIKASELSYLKTNDATRFEEVFTNATCKPFIFKVKAKMEMYQEEQKVRCSIVDAAPMNFVEESKKLLKLIHGGM